MDFLEVFYYSEESEQINFMNHKCSDVLVTSLHKMVNYCKYFRVKSSQYTRIITRI